MRETFLKTLIRRFALPTDSIRPILVGPLRGMWFRVNSITGLSAVYSGNERDNQRAFQRYIKPGDVVFDVGACWGLHSLLFSKLVGPSGQVFAFEPDPINLAELKFHLALNRIQNVQCVPVALSDTNGQATFYRAENAMMGSLIKLPGREGEAISIQTARLDDLYLPAPNFIKIDVEGAEMGVLRGAVQVLSAGRPLVLIDKDSDKNCPAWLEDAGYECTALSRAVLAKPR